MANLTRVGKGQVIDRPLLYTVLAVRPTTGLRRAQCGLLVRVNGPLTHTLGEHASCCFPGPPGSPSGLARFYTRDRFSPNAFSLWPFLPAVQVRPLPVG